MPLKTSSVLDGVLFLDLELVMYIHDHYALRTGGKPGMLKVDDLQGAIGRPLRVSDLVRIATYYWHGISTSHGFNDGNKRTALLAAIAFLSANGIVFAADEIDPGEMVIGWMARGEFELPLLETYLRERCSLVD